MLRAHNTSRMVQTALWIFLDKVGWTSFAALPSTCVHGYEHSHWGEQTSHSGLLGISLHWKWRTTASQNLHNGENCSLNLSGHSNWGEQASQDLYSGPAQASQDLHSGEKWFLPLVWHRNWLAKLMRGCLCVSINIGSIFHLSGGPVKLLQASLCVRKDTTFNHCGGSCRALLLLGKM